MKNPIKHSALLGSESKARAEAFAARVKHSTRLSHHPRLNPVTAFQVLQLRALISRVAVMRLHDLSKEEIMDAVADIFAA